MNELYKAIMHTGTHSNLYQTDLAPMIYDLLQDELPLWKLLGTENAMAPVHQYRVRSTIPEAWVQGELSSSDFQSATHVLRDVNLKIVRSWGGVSSFYQKLTERWLNALEENVTASVLGFANTVEFLLYYGNKTADTYQFNGVEAEILGHSTAKLEYANGGNVYDVNAAFTLTHLDNMIDRMKAYRGGNSDKHIIIMSRSMKSRISALQTRVTRLSPPIEYEGGFVMEGYNGVGFYVSDIVTPKTTTTSPAVTATASAGGSLPDLQRWYAISSVTIEGEQLVGAADDATTATTNNSTTLTWTADTTARLYKVYRGTTSTVADMQLLTVIPALTYDSNGNKTGNLTTWIDNGSLSTTASVHPLQTGMEILMGLNVDRSERGNRILGAVSPLGDPVDTFISYVPLATVDGSFKYMLESFMAAKIPYPTANIMVRRAKLA
jgi:hypothetical protein